MIYQVEFDIPVFHFIVFFRTQQHPLFHAQSFLI